MLIVEPSPYIHLTGSTRVFRLREGVRETTKQRFVHYLVEYWRFQKHNDERLVAICRQTQNEKNIQLRSPKMSSPDTSFSLYDLRVEVVCPEGKRIMCGAKEGDYFTLKGEMMYLPPDQGISIYSLCEYFQVFPKFDAASMLRSLTPPIASVLPLLAAKQRMTHKNDWMTTDALIACPDPCCPSQLRIVREGIRTFKHGDTTLVPLSGNTSETGSKDV